MKTAHGLPSPPTEVFIEADNLKPIKMEESLKSLGTKKNSSHKSTKPSHRISKRSSTSTAHTHLHSPTSPDSSHSVHSAADGRHKRVWKACERCRMKKTKCDGEFPCKRCKDDGLVCTAGTRKKTEFKQLPKGYAEVLEHTQFTLIATVHKLYSMLRNGEQWTLGEPDLNDRGLPVIHNIAQKLGCIRPNSDIDLPVHSVIPEDEKDLADLVVQLESQEKAAQQMRTDRASSSDEEHSDFEQVDHRKLAFGSQQQGVSAANLSPVSLSYESFDANPPPSLSSLPSTTSPITTDFAPWISPGCAPIDAFSNASFLQPQQQQPPVYASLDQLNSPAFMNMGILQQHREPDFTMRSQDSNGSDPELLHVLEMGDPFMTTGYDMDMNPVRP